MPIERLSVGIREIDEMLAGGIPKGFLVAVVGEPGCGKTVFCLSFINQGLINGNKCIFVTTEESRESIIRQAEQFNYDFRNAVEDGRLVIIDALMSGREDPYSLSTLDIEELVRKIIEVKKKFGYGHARLVIDSLSAFWLDKPAMARRYSYFIKKVLSKWNFTILVTSQYAISTSLPGYERILVKYLDKIFFIPIEELYKIYDLDTRYDFKVLSLNLNNGKLTWSPIINMIKHSYSGEIIKICLKDSRNISVSKGHSLILSEGRRFISKPSEEISEKDLLPTVSINIESDKIINIEKINSIKKCIVEKCYMYDISTEYGNFVAGDALAICHNSEAFGWGIEHIADGIIRFRRSIREGYLRRYILIEKMRQTPHDLRIYEIKIVNGRGIVIIGPTKYRREDIALPEHIMRRIKREIEKSRRELE